jgi:hypothetical protein
MADRNSNGQFIEGHKGFKPVGAFSKVSRKSQYYANKLFDSLKADGRWDKISEEFGVHDLINLIRIYTPKELKVNGNINHTKLDLNKLTNEQLERLTGIYKSVVDGSA